MVAAREPCVIERTPMSMVCDVYAVTPSDLDRLHNDPDFFGELTRYGNQDVTSCSLEKAWHGLHYLLSGDAWESMGPLAFVLAGGTEVDGSDGGYGPARSFTPDETRQINTELSAITDDQLWSRFDADAMTAQGIYPGIWNEPECDLKDEYTTYFRQVKQLIADAAARGHGLLITLG
jgi:hypothetical protein